MSTDDGLEWRVDTLQKHFERDYTAEEVVIAFGLKNPVPIVVFNTDEAEEILGAETSLWVIAKRMRESKGYEEAEPMVEFACGTRLSEHEARGQLDGARAEGEARMYMPSPETIAEMCDVFKETKIQRIRDMANPPYIPDNERINIRVVSSRSLYESADDEWSSENSMLGVSSER